MRGIAASIILASICILAQGPPEFEVASVKPQAWQGQGGVYVVTRGNTLNGEHVSLYDLVEFAYNLQDFQLSGGPAWAQRGKLASSDLFQVIAKAPGDAPPADAQFRMMLQSLLADRFRLQVHHAGKDLPVYNLVLAKSGPKLVESAADAKFSMNIDGGGPKPIRIRGTHVPLEKLVGYISRSAGRPVIDKTGLPGFYNFEVEWAEENLAASDPAGPSIFSALPERLGLKLESATAPFDTVVIDRAEKPSAN